MVQVTIGWPNMEVFVEVASGDDEGRSVWIVDEEGKIGYTKGSLTCIDVGSMLNSHGETRVGDGAVGGDICLVGR